MIKIENVQNALPSGIPYGGHSGSKKGIIFNNERWFLKYPKSTKSMEVKNLSYTTAPLSEYLGSSIYKLLGFDVHETKLGYANDKIIVLCKDFLDKNEVILDYNAIKNDYDEKIEEKLENLSSISKSHMYTDLEELTIVMNNNYYFKKVPKLKNLFWEMFVVDAFINNNDRNDNNWGLILNKDTMELRISPVYDNGASFYSKSADERIKNILQDEFKIKQVIYDSCVSSFSQNGKVINPLKFIESGKNKDCNEALLKIFPKINLKEIENLFNEVPLEYNGIPVFSKEQRDFYYKSLVYKYENVLKPGYEKLIKKNGVNNG